MDRRIKILISSDGSLQANAALKDMRRAGLPAEAGAVVMSIPKSRLAEGVRAGKKVVEEQIRRLVRRKRLKKPGRDG